MHFICFVENIRTSLRKIYKQINEKSRAGFFNNFLQIIAFYFFVENLRTSLRKIYGRINEKSRAGINAYFCIKKIFHLNGNVNLMIYIFGSIHFSKKVLNSIMNYNANLYFC